MHRASQQMKTTEELVRAYAKRITDTETRSGRDAAIERGRNLIRSWSLGRGFNETVGEHFTRNPEYAGFEAWFRSYQNPPKLASKPLVKQEIMTPKKGMIFYHDFQNRMWKIRISTIELDAKRPAWSGTIVGDQGNMKDGEDCWGYISELVLPDHPTVTTGVPKPLVKGGKYASENGHSDILGRKGYYRG